jgi:hypothetical protein
LILSYNCIFDISLGIWDLGLLSSSPESAENKNKIGTIFGAAPGSRVMVNGIFERGKENFMLRQEDTAGQ